MNPIPAKRRSIVWILTTALLAAIVQSAFALPDLVVQNVTLSTNMLVGNRTNTVTVMFNIRNQGTTAAVSSRTILRISQSTLPTSPNDDYMGSVDTPSIPTGNTISGLTKVLTDIPIYSGGGYYIWVVADADKFVSESNEGNNTAHSALLTIIRDAARPPINSMTMAGTNFSFLVAVDYGHKYVIESLSSLNTTNWTSVATNTGVGAPIPFTSATTAAPSRFFRIRVE